MADETTEVKFDDAQQALVNKLVGEARTKAREQAKADLDVQTAQAKEKAERDSLAAKNEWQKLAQTHEARVTELEPLVAQVEAYGKLITGMLKTQVKTLSDAGKQAMKTLPDSMTDLEKLGWLKENAELFQAEIDRARGTPRVSTKKTSKDAPPSRRKSRL